jgi:hypothetical protein
MRGPQQTKKRINHAAALIFQSGPFKNANW